MFLLTIKQNQFVKKPSYPFYSENAVCDKRRQGKLANKGNIVVKSLHNNVYLVLNLPVCKIAVCTQVPPHGEISMLRKSGVTIANRLPTDNRQVTNS